MDQLWRELKRLVAANRQAETVDALAAEAVAVYLLGELLDRFLPFSPTQARFMVNSVESVSTSPAAVVVRGRGYFGAPGFAARD